MDEISRDWILWQKKRGEDGKLGGTNKVGERGSIKRIGLHSFNKYLLGLVY